MQKAQKSVQPPERVNILLFDDYSNHCLANIVEPLRAANTLSRKTLYNWRFFTNDGQPVRSSSGLQVTPDSAVSHASGDLFVVMPSYGFREHAGWQTSRLIKAAARRHQRVAGLDTGSWLLADAGLLDGYRATIHWDEVIAFEEWFPEVHVERERYIVDRDRITCSGAMATYDLAMHLIAMRHGPFLAMEVAQLFMSLGDSNGPAIVRNPVSMIVQRAISTMQARIEEPLSISAVAKRVGVAQRSLEMRMKAEMQTTPQAIHRRLRIEQVRKLLQETDQAIAEIATRCGYENASAMSRAFKTEYHMTPRAMRESFR